MRTNSTSLEFFSEQETKDKNGSTYDKRKCFEPLT